MAEAYAGIRYTVGDFYQGPLPETFVQVATEISDAAAAIDNAGFAKGNGGNLSARCENGFLITATGVGMASVKAKEVAFVDEFDFENDILVRGRGLRHPSSETPMHALIYSHRPDVGAIAHMHIDLFLDEKVATKAGIPTTPEALPYGTKESALAALKALEKSDIIMMRGHGLVAVGAKIGAEVARMVKKYEEARRK